MVLSELYRAKKAESEERYDAFAIEEIGGIRRISEDAYLENPTWLGGDKEFVCLFIDLDNSSGMSFKHHPKVMAKIYDYFTQNIVDVLYSDPFRADYIDIKGDGAFVIFEGEQAEFKALAAALTFKTFFEKHIRTKFQTDTDAFNCKIGIDKDKVLVKKIGRRGDNNEVWAGRVVNHAAKLASLSKRIYSTDTNITPATASLLMISDKVYLDLKKKSEYTHTSCGHDARGNPSPIKAPNWNLVDCAQDDTINGSQAWYTSSLWCDQCGDRYMAEILK